METSEITRLRKLLLNLDNAELQKLKKLLNYPTDLAVEIAKVLPDAVLFSSNENDKLSSALIPMIETIITRSVAQNPNLLADALYPVIGRSIRKSINEEFKKLLQTFNELAENTFSPQSLKWRYQAVITGKKYSEIVIFNTIKYKAEHVFLIHRETGLLLCDVHDEMSHSADPDTISGMLKAITDFVHDSFENVGNSNLNLIELDDYQVLIEQGPYAILASLVKGYILDDYRSILEETLEQVHEEYASSLKNFSGDTFIFETSRTLLKKCLITEKKEAFQKKKKMGIGIVFAIPILAALLFLAGRSIFFSTEWNKYIKSLKTSETILLSQYGKTKGDYYAQGLLMPGSQHPDSLRLSYHFPQNGFKSKWMLYFPGESFLLESFLDANMGKQEGLTVQLRNHQIILQGWVTKEWFSRFPGFMGDYLSWFSVDTSNLNVFDIKCLTEKIDLFNEMHLYFEMGEYNLIPESELELKKQIESFAQIITQVKEIGKHYKLTISGYTDQFGEPAFNRVISYRRAQFVAFCLIESGISETNIEIIGNGEMENLSGLSGDEMRRVDFNLTLK